MVEIRDRRDCVTQRNLTDISILDDMTDLIESFTSSSSNRLQELLTIGNPTTKTQVTNMISQMLNQNNVDYLADASSSTCRQEMSL